ncbi:hypothetical protein AAE478_001723 [Parahypoxylon ruwenzoriense]
MSPAWIGIFPRAFDSRVMFRFSVQQRHFRHWQSYVWPSYRLAHGDLWRVVGGLGGGDLISVRLVWPLIWSRFGTEG